MPRYVPEAGDIVRLNFAPQAGREQAGHRPALLLSPASWRTKTENVSNASRVNPGIGRHRFLSRNALNDPGSATCVCTLLSGKDLRGKFLCRDSCAIIAGRPGVLGRLAATGAR